MLLTRMIITIRAVMDFSIEAADVKGAYMQGGPITRNIYVIPPKKVHEDNKTLWNLTSLPYGMIEAGRQWGKTAEQWMINEADLKQVHGSG